MSLFNRLSIATIISAAASLPSIGHAQIVSIAQSKLDHCGHGNVVCDGVQAFSLAAFESGLIQLPINRNQANEFVLVNDTGAPVRFLQFSYFGQLASNSQLTCHIEGAGQQLFHSCTVVGTASEGDGTTSLRGLIEPPAEFTYISDSSQAGIAEGASFDIRTAGFAHGGADRGYLGGTGGTGTGGTGTGGTGTGGTGTGGTGTGTGGTGTGTGGTGTGTGGTGTGTGGTGTGTGGTGTGTGGTGTGTGGTGTGGTGTGGGPGAPCPGCPPLK